MMPPNQSTKDATIVTFSVITGFPHVYVPVLGNLFKNSKIFYLLAGKCSIHPVDL